MADNNERELVTNEVRHEAAETASDFRLEVTSGPDRGESFDLRRSHASRSYLGKSAACALRLSDPLVSRRHAALAIFQNRLRVTDLASTNGTKLNGTGVIDAYASFGSTLSVGNTNIRVRRLSGDCDATIGQAPRWFGRLFGDSTEMRHIYSLCDRLAKSDVAVLIEGDTGTGKDVLAESLHDGGARAGKPFVVFDCTTVPTHLVESELFGHERGAFTGAVATRPGVFEQAHGGTLFIDEIGDLEPSLQSKLLRALERHEVRRVGGNAWIKCDVRVIASTRRDLEKEISAGRFRDDLFYRLAVARVELPPLSRRTGDATLLAHHFWAEMGGAPEKFPIEFFAKWNEHTWPGNVRELRNRIAHWMTLGDLSREEVESHDSFGNPSGRVDVIEKVLEENISFALGKERVRLEFERRFLERVLAQHGGNISRAAAAAGLSRRYFYVVRARQPKQG